MDVCPTPQTNICFECGAANPGDDHAASCKPECQLCRGNHPTGNYNCPNRYKTPYIVTKRQWEAKIDERGRANGEQNNLTADHFPSLHTKQPRQEERKLHRPRAASRGRSKSRERVSWADVTKQQNGKKMERDIRALHRTPSHSRDRHGSVQHDRTEIESLKEALAMIRQEFADYRKLHEELQQKYAKRDDECRLLATRLQQLELNQQREAIPRKESDAKNATPDQPGPAPKRRATGSTSDKKDGDIEDKLRRVEQ